MKIAIFETEDWEIEYLKKKLEGHELSFYPHTLTEDRVEDIKDVEALSVFIYSTLTKEVLEKLPSLKLVTTRSTGYDHIDMAYCKERGISVCNVPSYGAITVAEHTFALIMAVSRMIVPSVERTRKGDFEPHGLTGFDLHGKTLGTIGVGNIGTHVIQIAKGFGMKVVAHTRRPDPELAQKLGITFVSLDELLQMSDVISIHVPYSKETHHMINQENIKQVKKGSIIINTARGGIIETEALVRALEEGNVKGAGLDVLEEECYVKEERQLLTGKFLEECDLRTQVLNHVLLKKENVIVTPHNAFNSIEALHTILDTTVANIEGFADNNPQNSIAV